jgi:hypothetical protein
MEILGSKKKTYLGEKRGYIVTLLYFSLPHTLTLAVALSVILT